MKATLEFDTAEEREEFYNAINGDHYRAALGSVLELIRKEFKYNELSDDIDKKMRDLYGHAIEIVCEDYLLEIP